MANDSLSPGGIDLFNGGNDALYRRSRTQRHLRSDSPTSHI
jgi:hypothetical protein